MDYRKIPHPMNYRFARSLKAQGDGRRFTEAGVSLKVRDLGDDVFRLELDGRGWTDESLLPLAWKRRGPSRHAWSWRKDGSFSLSDGRGPGLQGKPGATFGVCGRSWMLQLQPGTDMRFYGFGEKSLPFERSGQATCFWNTDVWADFTAQQCGDGATDPMYVSVPWMLIKRERGCVGILVENPHPTYMGTGKKVSIASQQDAETDACLFVGAADGAPRLTFIAGGSAEEVVEKLQRLCGTTPLPPLWALGHHQCRWGYKDFADLDRLDRGFRRHGIPCDGLWLDIDYMDRFKVFTIDRRHFKSPKAHFAELLRRGRRVVPILDPGVKAEAGYEVYDDGLKRKVFCRNPEGGVFKGFVWPGATAFPDFSLARVRDWWARRVQQLAASGISGAWLDMNEPALGGVVQEDMLFGEGTRPHAAFHNQYALGMAMASRDGFLRARPDRRPFLLSRAGFIGSSRFAAIWTGDNCSNWTHLRGSIGLTLNLALSGIPFNAPDVPGFGHDATPELAEAWYKAAFLFPFLRNHSSNASREQEPWAFGGGTTRVLRHYIRLRYKLLPTLYNLFIDQAESGAAILRPLFFEDPGEGGPDLDRIDDQFMVGRAILQAPVLAQGKRARALALPAGGWFNAATGAWTRGGRRVRAACAHGHTPLYVREGSLLVTQAGEPTDNRPNLRDLELHVFLRSGVAEADYRCDDGESFAFEDGGRTHLRLRAEARGGELRIGVETLAGGFGPCTVRVVTYAAFGSVTLVQGDVNLPLAMAPHTWAFTGRPLKARISKPFTCGE